MRKSLCRALLALGALTAAIPVAAQTTVTVQAAAAGARAVPPLASGANLVAYAHDPTTMAPCCLEHMADLQLPGWRIPGGTLSLYWHWLTGEYNCNWQPNGSGGQMCSPTPGAAASGPSFDQWIQAIEPMGVIPIVTLNWEASDQEMLNLVEYANAPVPASPDPAWTTASYAQDQQAPAGYFAWLRAQRLHAQPVGIRYWELGNEIYGTWETDYQTNNDGAKYGARAASLIPKIHAIDANSRAGVVGWWSGFDGPMLSAMATAGVRPDFLIQHGYAWCNNTSQMTTDESNLMSEPNNRASDIAGIRSEVSNAFAGYGSQIEVFYTEFGPDGCNPTEWMVDNMWGAIYVVRQYAEALEAGYSNIDFWAYTQGTGATPYSAFIEGATPPFASTFFGMWLAGRFAKAGDTLLQVSGASGNLSAYAVAAINGSTRVLLVNRDTANIASVHLVLQGSTASSMARLTYDQTLGGNGTTTRHDMTQAPAQDTLALSGSAVDVTLTPESVQLLSTAATGSYPDGGALPDGGTNKAKGGCGCAAPGGSTTFVAGMMIWLVGLSTLRRRRPAGASRR